MGNKKWGKSDANAFIEFGEGPWDFEGTSYENLGEQCDSAEELRLAWQANRQTGFEVFPVEYHDYGSNGGRLHYCDHEDADGYIFVAVPWTDPLSRLAFPDFNPKEAADSVRKMWNQYLEGDIHWARIEDSDGETIDSCAGFYGSKDAEEWCKETVEYYVNKTREVKVVVTHGTLPLPFPATVTGSLLEIEVPLRVGDKQIPEWVVTEGPFKDDRDVLQVDLYRRAQ
jgi:hypothetical protein